MGAARAQQQKKETTRSITYRLPENLINELDGESKQKKISQNVLVKQILERYIQWDRYSEKVGMIPVPKEIIQSLGADLDGRDIDEIINVIFPMIKNTVMFIKGGYDLERCIETLEDYMRASGMKSDHRIEGDLHSFIIQHDLGMKWSVFTEQLLTQVFRNFASDKDLKFQTTDSTVILKVALGSDFNEHDYQSWDSIQSLKYLQSISYFMNASSKTLQLWIRELLDNSVLSVNSTVPAEDVAKLMENSNAGAIIVLENQAPVGIVTNKDLSIKIIAHSYPADTPVRRIMSTPLISITPETEIEEAVKLMSSKKIRKLPIISDDEVMGIVIASDIASPIPEAS